MCQNSTFYIFQSSSIYCAALCCRNASAPGDEWSGGLQMVEKVVFQKRWLHFNLNLHGDICFYPLLWGSASPPAPFINQKKKNNSHHHLLILLHANLVLQSGSSLFSSLCRAPLLSTVSPCPAACWHFCLIWLPDHLAHESLPTVVLWTMLPPSIFQLLTVRPPSLQTPHTSCSVSQFILTIKVEALNWGIDGEPSRISESVIYHRRTPVDI